MSMIVYLNNTFTKAEDAKISIYDRAFLYGDAAFEILRAYHHYIFKFQEHIERFHNSLKKLGIELPLSATVIFKAMRLLLEYNKLSDASIRISITRGESPITLDTSLCSPPTVLITSEFASGYPHQWYLNGISVIITTARRVPAVCIDSSIVSSNCLINILARREVQNRGAQEGIFLNIEGYISEGTESNIFLVKDNSLLTPAVSSGILNGITRQVVIELAESRGLDVIERHILPEEIFSADECFLTDTSMGIMPVIYCDGIRINDGHPGKITRFLMKDYKKLIEKKIKENRREIESE